MAVLTNWLIFSGYHYVSEIKWIDVWLTTGHCSLGSKALDIETNYACVLLTNNIFVSDPMKQLEELSVYS